MIISIEISAAEASEQPREKLEEFFSEVLRSSRRGHHIVVIPRALASWTLGHIQLSGHDRAHLERLKEEFTQLGSLRSDPDSRVLKVVSTDQGIQRIGDHAWSISVDSMLAGRFLEKPILLLENATNDGDLYIELFSHEARRRGIRSLAYEVANGGGGTTFQEVYRLAKLQHVVVCICDHDKLSPYSQNSETFRKAASTAKHSDLVGTVVTTPGREVENFLPLDLVLDIVPNFPIDQRKKLEDLITVQGPVQPRDCLWLFFDVKEGICSNKLLKKCKSIDAQRWAEEKYKIDLQVDKIAITGFGETVVAQLLDDGALLAKLYKFTRSQYWLHHFAPWFDAFLPFLQSRLTSRV